MIKLNFPDKRPRLKLVDGTERIFCIARKKWVVLTPEEWVRQHIVMYLTEVKNYPLPLIAVEKKVKVGELSQRFDVLVFNQNAQPNIIVECKEMDVPLNEGVLLQSLRYNIPLRATIIIITNGNETFAYRFAQQGFVELDEIPAFS